MIDPAHFTRWSQTLLAEAFGMSPAPHGYFLDDGQSGLLAVIATIDAAVASTAPHPGGETIASHCNHVLYFLRLFERYEHDEQPATDWPGSWKNQSVDEATWNGLRTDLRAAYDTMQQLVQSRTDWSDAAVGGLMITLTHSAYHVGEIRQLLTVVGTP